MTNATVTPTVGVGVKTTVIISYNEVTGFKPGWHGERRLFVCANKDGAWGANTGCGGNDIERAASVMASISHGFYGKLEVPVEVVDCFYIYAGLYRF